MRPPVNNEKREGRFFGRVEYWADLTGVQPTANSSTEGRGVSLNVWCVCVWEEGGGRERDSVFAGCDRPAYRVLRVGPRGLLYSPVITGSPLPREVFEEEEEEEEDNSGHQCLLMLDCTEPPKTQWRLAPQSNIRVWILISRDCFGDFPRYLVGCLHMQVVLSGEMFGVCLEVFSELTCTYLTISSTDVDSHLSCWSGLEQDTDTRPFTLTFLEENSSLSIISPL